jgi:dienelactone hydrolase
MMLFHLRRSSPARTMIRLVVSVLGLIAAAILSLVMSRPARAQSAPRSAAYVITRGNDTLVVERLQRTAARTLATVSLTGQPSIELDFTLTPAHGVSAARFTVRLPNAAADAAPAQEGTVTFIGDSAILTMKAAGQERTLRVGTKAGALPVANNDFVVAEQMVRMARAQKVSKLTKPIFLLTNAQTMEATLELVGADSARFTILTNVTELAIDADGNVTGGAIPFAGLKISVVTGPAMAGISVGRPNYDAPADAPYTAEHVTVKTPAGHSLAGTLTKPRAVTGKLPAVVTITGSGHQDRDEYIAVAGGFRLFRQVADTLSRRGIAVLRLDDRGIGGSGGDVNGTSADFADDIRAAIAYLRSRADIDPARIALVGHSEGGMIAPMVAVTDPQLAGIALLAGTGYTGQRIIDYQIENGIRGGGVPLAQQDSMIAAQKAELAKQVASNAWMRYFLTYDPIPTAKKVKQPVLILQGATDQQVRVEEARMLDAAIRGGGNRRVTLKIMPDRNHLFLRDPNGHPSGYANLKDPKIDGEVLGVLADWVATTLGAK